MNYSVEVPVRNRPASFQYNQADRYQFSGCLTKVPINGISSFLSSRIYLADCKSQCHSPTAEIGPSTVS